MQFSSIASFVSILLAFSVDTLSASSSVSRLERRDKTHAPYTHVYTMKRSMDYSKGPLPIYSSDGTIAFLFMKSAEPARFRNVIDGHRGHSQSVVMTNTSVPLLTLSSTNDFCYADTLYKEQHPTPAEVNIKLHTNGAFKDDWRVNFRSATGVRQSFKFDRDYWDKEGKIYNSQTHQLVGKLSNEKRRDPWMTDGHGSVKAYTLSCTPDAPQLELVALMGLVLHRVAKCSL
ncbi:hypothetical protein PtA15_8A527 [Puccinia triticina]|uniref:Uncharacterized protein n=1 Tax=Puccinia triticina TaxID=208348 RepID=A0ABY7CT43_9BASI|nr:uncharacterized protein PtA15_8A527 [Puccinia triticina]WAQ87622.1 hypothetical protein PtA15_8A527 [Puccinia triticina]